DERRLLAADLPQRGFELRRALAGEGRVQRPVLDGDEYFDLALAIDDEAHGDGLHAARREAAADLFPEQRREAVTHEAIQHSARLLGIDLVHVDLARLGERRLDRALRDLVERDAVDLLLVDRQLLSQVPADRLALAIRVGRDVESVRLLRGLL